MAKTKAYEIAENTAITSKGVVLDAGTVVTKDDFISDDTFKALVAAKKIVEVTVTKDSATDSAADTTPVSTGSDSDGNTGAGLTDGSNK